MALACSCQHSLDFRTNEEQDAFRRSRISAISSSPEPTQKADDPLEIATDQAIAACNGDLRSTVQALIMANSLLEAELRDVYATASKGYARGRTRSKHD